MATVMLRLAHNGDYRRDDRHLSVSVASASIFDPQRFVGKVAVYGLAFDGAARFLHWLSTSIMHEFGR